MFCQGCTVTCEYQLVSIHVARYQWVGCRVKATLLPVHLKMDAQAGLNAAVPSQWLQKGLHTVKCQGNSRCTHLHVTIKLCASTSCAEAAASLSGSAAA